FFFSSSRRHTRCYRDWSSDVCASDLPAAEKLSTYQAYMADPEMRRRSWQSRLAHPAWTAEPNQAHRALARLACSAIDTQVITQRSEERRVGTAWRNRRRTWSERRDGV